MYCVWDQTVLLLYMFYIVNKGLWYVLINKCFLLNVKYDGCCVSQWLLVYHNKKLQQRKKDHTSMRQTACFWSDLNVFINLKLAQTFAHILFQVLRYTHSTDPILIHFLIISQTNFTAMKTFIKYIDLYVFWKFTHIFIYRLKIRLIISTIR